jgi:hypothetical protein
VVGDESRLHVMLTCFSTAAVRVIGALVAPALHDAAAEAAAVEEAVLW